MADIQIFNNEQFGEIRTVVNESGEPLFCASDVAKALGYARPADAVTDHCKGVYILPTPTNGGVQQVKFIKEADVYRLVMKSKAPNAEMFQDWVCEEVLPSIRKHGGYLASKADDTPEMIMARAVLVAQATIEKQNKLIEEKSQQLDESKEWFSIKRWAKLHRRNWRTYSWRKLKAVSHELGYEVKKIFDGNYDEVNIYHRDVFEAVYGK